MYVLDLNKNRVEGYLNQTTTIVNVDGVKNTTKQKNSNKFMSNLFS